MNVIVVSYYGNRIANRKTLPNGEHSRRIQFCHWIFRSKWLSPLPHHIRHVLVIRAKKEMVRIHTSPNITSMEDTLTIWNLSVCHHPGHSMSAVRFSSKTTLTIAVMPLTSCP